ncbi:glycosyltransferase family 87 protein [Pigmentibacter sp. JX0631]|uniref:glycosyltransferase family 87 protein n=1 Tax=Pigmentibacter sp. JX0631 TaxID=2976982 RepID=UPI002468FA3C|nr:glycosyltransferase family 87 protein [Pigmentibacter sp. JX0631]WGL61298.1 glycosyltransferase family 87 protein [Pigmentibacter sp. JX0631]
MQYSQNVIGKNFFYKNSLLFFIFIFTAIFILIELKNGRYWQSDFEVYYKAAVRMLNSENLYRIVEDNFYRYKYSPAAAILYTPFTLLPFEIAKYSYTFFLSFLIYIIIKISYKMSKIDDNYIQTYKNKLFVYCIIMVGIANNFTRELHLGQANIIILFFSLFSVYTKDKNRFLSAFFLAYSGIIKPYFILFIVYYILQKEFKYLLYLILSILIISFIPLIFFNFNSFIENYQLWFNEIKIEILRERSEISYGNISIFTFFDNFFISILNLKKELSHIITLSLTGIFTYLFLIESKKKLDKNLRSFYNFSFLLSLIPLLASNGRSIYIFSFPLIFLTSFIFKRKNNLLITLYIIAIFLIGINFGDIQLISTFIRKYSLMPLGVLILLSILFYNVKKIKITNTAGI